MPKPRQRKFTEFVFGIDAGIEVKVPVWIIQTDENATFTARLDEMDIQMSGSDINALRESVRAEVKKKSSLTWTPYFYLSFATNRYSTRRVEVEGLLKSIAPDGTVYWLMVALPQDLETGEIEQLAEWKGETKLGGARPSTYAPTIGKIKLPYVTMGHAVLLPVTGESISHIRRVLALERECNALLTKLVRDSDPRPIEEV